MPVPASSGRATLVGVRPAASAGLFRPLPPGGLVSDVNLGMCCGRVGRLFPARRPMHELCGLGVVGPGPGNMNALGSLAGPPPGVSLVQGQDCDWSGRFRGSMSARGYLPGPPSLGCCEIMTAGLCLAGSAPRPLKARGYLGRPAVREWCCPGTVLRRG